MIHDRSYTRAKTWSKASRKYHIDRDLSAGRWSLTYDNLHQYADNKIHCSCALCRTKTNNKNHRSFNKTTNWDIADRKKLDNMKEQIDEME